MTFDTTLHLIEVVVAVLVLAGTVAGFGWAVLRKLNVIIDALIEFPPHRHVGRKIIFPKAFSPSPIEKPDFQSQ